MAKGETPYAIATAFRLIGIRWQGMQADFHWQIIKAKAGFKKSPTSFQKSSSNPANLLWCICEC
jgi:hypothetical protein